MEITAWIGGHGFDLLQATGIVGGLFSIAYSIWDNSRTRRVENLFQITAAHRDIWSALYRNPELNGVLQAVRDVTLNPPTPKERLFLRLLILHLASVFRASEFDEVFVLKGLRADISQFFSRPLPSLVWKELRLYQESEFVRFVEDSLTDGGSVSAMGE